MVFFFLSGYVVYPVTMVCQHINCADFADANVDSCDDFGGKVNVDESDSSNVCFFRQC
jgi:hypothetical protein